jgi:hypothetical protein
MITEGTMSHCEDLSGLKLHVKLLTKNAKQDIYKTFTPECKHVKDGGHGVGFKVSQIHTI